MDAHGEVPVLYTLSKFDCICNWTVYRISVWNSSLLSTEVTVVKATNNNPAYLDSQSAVIDNAQLSPSDRAMRLVSSNLANCHATVQKLLIREVLTKLMVWSWRFSRRKCVMNNVHSTMMRRSRFPLSLRCHNHTDDGRIVYITCILAVAKFSKSTT